MRFSLIWTYLLLHCANEDFLTGPQVFFSLHNGLLSPTSSPNNVSIAIIGAGFAGLSAFNALIEHGFSNIHIFEGSSRVGGRVFPLEFDGIFLQQGAEFINGRQNPIFEMAEQLHLVVGEVEDAALIDANGGGALLGAAEGCGMPSTEQIASFAEFTDNLELQYAQMANKFSDKWEMTIAELFAHDYAEFLQRQNASDGDARRQFDSLAQMYMGYYEGEWAAPVDKLALRNYAAWKDSTQSYPYSSFTLDSRGYAPILGRLSKDIPPERIHLNSRVTNINYEGDRTRLTTVKTDNREQQPQTTAFDFVVVTVPIGHLKRHAASLFSPPLPAQKLRAIEAIGFGAMQKVFLVYDRPFWPANATSLVSLGCEHAEAQQSHTPLHTLQPHPWNKNILVAWLSGSGSERANALTDEQLAEVATAQLGKLLSSRGHIPTPKRIIRTKWLEDELFLGSYTFITPEASRLAADRDPFALLAHPVYRGGAMRVLFAGEATQSHMYQTTIGAFLSGQREANRLASYVGAL